MIRVRAITRMEASPDPVTPPVTSSSNRYGIPSASNIIQAPLSLLLEHLGILRSRSNQQETEPLINNNRLSSGFRDALRNRLGESSVIPNDGEVSISIIGAGEQRLDREGEVREVLSQNEVSIPAQPLAGMPSATVPPAPGNQERSRTEHVAEEGVSQSVNANSDAEAGDGVGANARDSSSQRYDIQQAARWIEQVLPFSLLLLVVFIRQHLQGFFVTIWVTAVLFKSNDILRKQTALKGERKFPVLITISIAFTLHVVGVYWWCQNNDMLYPLAMLPPKVIPPFWHVIFIITVNDALVRQAGMVFKCILLMYYKNGRGRNYRKQGQMLTLVEYLLLLYRALLPTPVWYRFFLNKEYGSFFSSLMTGLYLTFKLTSVIEKVQSFFAAVKALSRKEVHYGAYATSEQVNAVGDLCAICQEKMHTPILLSCNHIFCEECVSEWFERERTCPLCRALVKPADLKSFGDGSTSLFFQLF
ncbi:E3 ubiquitin-protein ligase RNFT1 [Neltuma alba]|uniref:E3 ubiquitin-protein ligase RNFT1 n=1 Tax=Neltuma alba TaxID=207710 RepID=UPI0010A34B71|nr:E3 ubiquitin-protein ligase RNFT1 [Prosopis alba]